MGVRYLHPIWFHGRYRRIQPKMSRVRVPFRQQRRRLCHYCINPDLGGNYAFLPPITESVGNSCAENTKRRLSWDCGPQGSGTGPLLFLLHFVSSLTPADYAIRFVWFLHSQNFLTQFSAVVRCVPVPNLVFFSPSDSYAYSSCITYDTQRKPTTVVSRLLVGDGSWPTLTAIR